MGSFDPFAGAGKDIFSEESGPGVPQRTRRSMRLLDRLLGLGYGEGEGLDTGSVLTQQSPLETLSLTGLEEQAKGITTGEGHSSLGKKTTADVLSQAGPAFDKYFEDSVQNPLLQLFSEKIIPQLDTELARSGFFGSARERSLGGATDRLTRTLTEEKAGLSKDLLDTRLKGAGLATTQATADTSTLLNTLDAGDTQRRKELQRIQMLFGLGGLGNDSNAPLQESDLAAQRANDESDLQLQQAVLKFLLG